MSRRSLAVFLVLLAACGPSAGGDVDAGADGPGPEADGGAPPDSAPPACDESTCDPLQGLSCSPTTGRCEGACAGLGTSYIGCEYYPTVTANDVDNRFEFAVAVSNTGAAEATVTIDGGALPTSVTLTVPVGRVVTQTLPWQRTLKGCNSMDQRQCGPVTGSSAHVPGGAYRLRSTQPVTVYQFNPLDYGTPDCDACSFTNDASLLIPVNAMGTDYVAATYQAWDSTSLPNTVGLSPSLLAITATRDVTRVTVTPTASSAAGDGVPGLAAGTARTLILNRGDVVQLMAMRGDFTGSWIVADAPVQVLGAHYCTQIPQGTSACDHLEESMFSIDRLGASYLVTAPAVPSLPDGKVEVVRIVATDQDTTLTFDPPVQPPTTIARAGEFVELPATAASFRVTASKKVLVAQYMTGQGAGGNTGDPAMALAVPIAQYRTSYQFHAPTNYPSNYVNITAPTGATVRLDGADVRGFTPIGATGFGVARVVLSSAGTGDHVVTASQPVGVSVYGYGRFTSYWYPGGLQLDVIDPE